jgi:hypothetical protein
MTKKKKKKKEEEEEPETNSNKKNCRDLYGSINEFKKYYEPITIHKR